MLPQRPAGIAPRVGVVVWGEGGESVSSGTNVSGPGAAAVTAVPAGALPVVRRGSGLVLGLRPSGTGEGERIQRGRKRGPRTRRLLAVAAAGVLRGVMSAIPGGGGSEADNNEMVAVGPQGNSDWVA